MISHRALIFIFPCLAAVAGSSAAPAAPPAPLPAAFRQWMASQHQAVDIRVPFRMTRTLPTMKDRVIEQGMLWRFADKRFRFQIGEPPVSILLFDTKDLWTWEKSANQWRVIDPKDRQNRMWLTFLTGEDLQDSDLGKNFTFVPNGESATALNVSLMPKSGGLRRHVSQLDLTIHPKEIRLTTLRVLQTDGTTLRMDFENPVPVTAKDQTLVQPAPPIPSTP